MTKPQDPLQQALRAALSAAENGDLNGARLHATAAAAAASRLAGSAAKDPPAVPAPAMLDKRSHSQSLLKGLAILALFSEERPVWKLSDIAEHLELTRSSTHRYLTTLVALGHLRRTSGRQYARGGETLAAAG